jgi:putative cell wall-binding protein
VDVRPHLPILATVAIATALLGPSVHAADGQSDVKRIAGANRFETAAALARDRYPSASDAVLARADDPADALGGSYLGGTHIGPVLLAEPHNVPQITIDTYHALRVNKVRVLGGAGALGPEVDQQLRAEGFVVERVAGNDRYETAAAIAHNSGAPNIGVRSGLGRTVMLANGQSPADALSAGPIIYGQQWPVLLTTRDAIPGATTAALNDLGIQHVVVVGGTAAVSDAVVQELQQSGHTVERVAGADRESTATALGDFMIAIGEPLERVELAAASSFADALVLGGHAAPNAPVLLCHQVDDCGTTTIAWIMEHSDAVDLVVIAGGIRVVGEAAEVQLRLAAA